MPLDSSATATTATNSATYLVKRRLRTRVPDGFDADRLKEFFHLLPRDTRAAATLAHKHNDKLKGRAFTKIDMPRRLCHAIEVRHPSFMVAEFFDLLKKHEIGFVVADTAGKFPYAEDLTADFVYIRLHGAEKLYVSGYNDRALDWWANRIKLWQKGRQPRDAKLISKKTSGSDHDVFVYFDNDAKVHAPFDARSTACAPSTMYAKNTSSCQNASSRSTSCNRSD